MRHVLNYYLHKNSELIRESKLRRLLFITMEMILFSLQKMHVKEDSNAYRIKLSA